MTRIININKIICTLKKFGDSNNKITKNGLFGEVVKKPQIGEGNVDKNFYEKHVKVCHKLEILNEKEGNFILTDFGQDVYNTIAPEGSNHKNIDDKSKKLKQKLILKILEKKEFIKKELAECYTDIQIENGDINFLINKKEIDKINKNVLELLKDVGLISYKKGQHQIASKIGHRIPRTRTVPTSEEQLHDILKNQIENGKKAEIMTIEFEKNRLRKQGVKEQILDRITRISKKNVSAGYDIDSFNGPTVGVNFDRFIEVKATTGDYPVFYWSENEKEKAKKYGEKYFIYIWINFGKEEQELIDPIQNPYKQIIEENYEKVKEISTYRVTWDK